MWYMCVLMSLAALGLTSAHRLTLEERLEAMEKRMTRMETMINKPVARNKRVAGNIDGIAVAFSAALDHDLGTIPIYGKIPFNKLYINDGSSYDNSTGIFTAPYDGVYLLSFFIAEYQPGQIVTRLMLDGVNIADSVAESIVANHNDHGGNVVILKLNMGQQAWIETFDTHNVHIDASRDYLYNTFSGFLLYGL